MAGLADVSAELVTGAEFAAARERIRGAVLHTPLVRLASITEVATYIKPESLQPIGSFKLRGAYNAVASLSDEQRRRGVITYSSGNHGQGVAYAARAFGIPAVIVMPANAPEIKRKATSALGAQIVGVGPASSERKEHAEALAAVGAGRGDVPHAARDRVPGVRPGRAIRHRQLLERRGREPDHWDGVRDDARGCDGAVRGETGYC